MGKHALLSDPIKIVQSSISAELIHRWVVLTFYPRRSPIWVVSKLAEVIILWWWTKLRWQRILWRSSRQSGSLSPHSRVLKASFLHLPSLQIWKSRLLAANQDSKWSMAALLLSLKLAHYSNHQWPIIWKCPLRRAADLDLRHRFKWGVLGGSRFHNVHP